MLPEQPPIHHAVHIAHNKKICNQVNKNIPVLYRASIPEKTLGQ